MLFFFFFEKDMSYGNDFSTITQMLLKGTQGEVAGHFGLWWAISYCQWDAPCVTWREVSYSFMILLIVEQWLHFKKNLSAAATTAGGVWLNGHQPGRYNTTVLNFNNQNSRGEKINVIYCVSPAVVFLKRRRSTKISTGSDDRWQNKVDWREAGRRKSKLVSCLISPDRD